VEKRIEKLISSHIPFVFKYMKNPGIFRLGIHLQPTKLENALVVPPQKTTVLVGIIADTSELVHSTHKKPNTVLQLGKAKG